MDKQLNLYKEFFGNEDSKKKEEEIKKEEAKSLNSEKFNKYSKEEIEKAKEKVLSSKESLRLKDFAPLSSYLKEYQLRVMELRAKMTEAESQEEKGTYYGMLTFPEDREEGEYKEMAAIFQAYTEALRIESREAEEKKVITEAIKRKRQRYPKKEDVEKYENDESSYNDPYKDIYPQAPDRRRR